MPTRPARCRSPELVGVVGARSRGSPSSSSKTAPILAIASGLRAAESADVPLEAGDLRRVGQVRRADVSGRVAARPVEHPGLGVEPRRRRVVGDPDLGAERGELVERALLGAVRVGRREHAERLAGLAVAAERRRRRGRIPLQRMNAITTSIASAEAISARTSWATAGSPGALVSTVVSSSGVSGRSTTSALPSGRRRRMAWSTRPGSSGTSFSSPSAASVRARGRRSPRPRAGLTLELARARVSPRWLSRANGRDDATHDRPTPH